MASGAWIFWYFVREDTPFSAWVNKRLDAMTLRDFKDAFDPTMTSWLPYRPPFRYFFKTTFQHVGNVKVEISDESALLPSFDGAIHCWITQGGVTVWSLYIKQRGGYRGTILPPPQKKSEKGGRKGSQKWLKLRFPIEKQVFTSFTRIFCSFITGKMGYLDFEKDPVRVQLGPLPPPALPNYIYDLSM